VSTTLANFINNEHRPPAAGEYLSLIEPATGQVVGRVPDSGIADIDAAVAAADAAFASWSGLPAAERSRLLLRLADLIDANLDRLADAESRDTGKPITLAREVDIPRSAANFRYFATAILHTSSDLHAFDGGGVPGGISALNHTLRSPRGVAGLISPWNLPLYLLTWKIAPALATGNTAVCKPSEVTPLTAFLLGELAAEAGLPPGVLNIVHGRGPTAGAALVTHDRVPTISFTGSTAVGRWIGRECGERLKRVSLELGGKNPFIVCQDADLDAAVATAVRAGFTNQGQICLCGSRLLLHESIAGAFLERFVAGVKALTIGDPGDSKTRFGALTSREHLAKVESYVQMAVDLGGRILCGGSRVDPATLPPRCRRGLFFAPTVIDGLASDCRVETEEIFGPVVTTQRFKTEDEALRLANGTPYGLAAVVFSQDISRVSRLSTGLHAGIVWVNCWMVRDLRTPFGGAKQSGVGREGGLEALRFFTEPKNVCVRS
jgi:aminomuconate-semialdehyde/2-hydroxymuconate-6-semialdehyde dehydrogenase